MKYKILHNQPVYSGFLKLDRLTIQHQRYQGGWSEPLLRERIKGRHAVSVLLYDGILDRVVLIEQFRIGAVDHGYPWLLETVGGYCEPNEKIETVAQREVKEETGCSIQNLTLIGDLLSSPGWSGEKISLFCAEVDSRQAGGIHGCPEEGEDIRVVVMDRQIAFQECFQRANSTSVIIALQWLQLNLSA